MQRWSSNHLTPLQPQKLVPTRTDTAGRFPLNIWLKVFQYSTLPDIRTLSYCCRNLAALHRDEAIWKFKLALLGYTPPAPAVHPAPDPSPPSQNQTRNQQETEIKRSNTADEFGDFVDAPLDNEADLLKFDAATGESAGHDLSQPFTHSHQKIAANRKRDSRLPVQLAATDATTARDAFKAAYSYVMPFYTSLQTHTTSSLLFTQAGLSPMERALLLRALSNLLLQPCSPSRSAARHTIFKRNLQSAKDFFESTLFADFEKASKKSPQPDEQSMSACTHLAAKLGDVSAQSLFDVFINAREIFYESSHNPHWNIVRDIGQDVTLDFSAMDNYMSYIIQTVKRDASLAARVFPKHMNVVKDYADRVAQDAVSVRSSLSFIQLRATRAAFRISWTSALFSSSTRNISVPSSIRRHIRPADAPTQRTAEH